MIGLSVAVPRIGTALTAILVGAIPLFSSVIGRLMKIENIDRLGFIGLFLGFIGIIFLVGFPQEKLSSDFLLDLVYAPSVVSVQLLGAIIQNLKCLRLETGSR